MIYTNGLVGYDKRTIVKWVSHSNYLQIPGHVMEDGSCHMALLIIGEDKGAMLVVVVLESFKRGRLASQKRGVHLTK